MKKLFALILALAMLFAFTACGDGNETVSSEIPESSEAPVSSEAADSTEPASSEAPTISIAPVSEVESLNLALKGTAIADSVNDDPMFGDGLAALNDGSKTTRWQANEKAEVPEDATDEEKEAARESEENPSWYGILWDEAQTFDTLIADYEWAHPLEDGYRVEISDDGENWTSVAFDAVRDGTMDEEHGILKGDHQIDTITLKEAATAKAVRVVCFTYYTVPDIDGVENQGNPKSPTSVYEFEVYYSVDVEAAENADENAEETTAE